MGKPYGIGVGPGDPELLVLKTCRILNATDVIFCPEEEARVGGFAFDIIQGLLEDTKAEIINSIYPIHYHGVQLREVWKQNTGCIAWYLNGDRTDAFITLGDPAVYSTFMYTLPCIEEAGVEVEVVPGITSSCAVADSVKIPLVAWNEDLVIASVRKNSSENLERVLGEYDNVVLMRLSTDPQTLLKALKGNHLEDRFVLTTKTGTGEKRLATNSEELERYGIPYFSTVIIEKQGRQ